MDRLRFLLSAVLLSLAVPPASAQTWSGTAGDGNWNNASNWLPGTIPNAAAAAVTFGNAGAGMVNISSSVQANSLNFSDVGAGSFTLTSGTGQTLSGLTSINYLSSGDSGTQTISLAYQAGGNLVFANNSSLTITNNAGYVFAPGNMAPGLVIGPATVIGSSGVGGVVVTGVGGTTLSGSFASGSVVGGLTKSGGGELDFSGDGTQLQGGLTLNGGTLILDYTTNPASKLGSGNLTLSGGNLSIWPNATVVTQQSVDGTILAANHTEISASANAGGTVVVLNLGPITRSPGATVDFSPASNVTFSANTPTGNTNGLLGPGPAYATFGNGFGGGATWATNSGGTISGLPDSSYGIDTYSAGTNTDFVSPFQGLPANTTTNSIRFNASTTSSLYVLTNLTLQSGGILMTANSGPVSILPDFGGDTITGGTGELLIHQYNATNALTINAGIVASGGLTKTGWGTLVLGGINFGLTGPINLNQGNLTVTRPVAVNFASTINLNLSPNDNGTVQSLAFDLGNSINGTVSTNIGLGANFAEISTGSSTNSTVTLSGVISSIPGQAAGIAFGSEVNPQFFMIAAITSGINLTNINNSFLGEVVLSGGTLGITSNASLGNAANTLYLQVGNSTAGGLVFLNGGVNLARPVVLLAAASTRIVSNGSDVNTISGVISDFAPATYGGGRLYKAGSGTLVLSNINTYSGGTQIDAGTLSVGADANLGAAAGSVSINSGATLGITGSFSTARPLLLGPTSVTAANGPANIAVATGQTFTPTGGISDGFGPGTLALTGPGTVALTTPNLYTGGTAVQRGTLLTSADANLGAASGPVAIGPLGTLTYTASDSTSRTFTMNSGTLSVASGQTLTLNGATIGGGFLAGPGVFAVAGGTLLTGVTTYASTPISVTGASSFTNFANGGPLTVAAGITGVSFTRFTNQGSGAIAIGAGSQVNTADFQTYGMLSLAPNTTAAPTILTNTGTSPLFFNGGSQTFIGTPGTADPTGQNIVDYVDLHGNNAIVAGGYFVNNGGIYDTVGAGTGTIIADYGALVKGAGFYQNTVKTQNGGKYQTGNSPGSATFGNFVFGPGGVNNYIFAIDDATGTAGPSPNAAGLVSGWGLIKAVQASLSTGTTSGNFTWTATPSNPLTVAIDTLVNPTMVGTDVAGPMADFDPNQPYSWSAAHWSGAYSGPTDAAMLDADTSFDTSGFVNPINGTFGWSLDSADQTLSLVYSPSSVPEPGTLALMGLAGLVAGWRRRRFCRGTRCRSRAHLSRLASVALALAAAVPARGQTWANSTTNGDWNTPANWSSATVPNSTTAAVTFPDGAPGTVNISSSVSAQSLNFTNLSGSYTLASSAGQTLSGLTAITVAAGVTGTDTINLANAATGSLLFASGSNLTITNNSTSSASTLVIGPNTMIGTPGYGAVIFSGSGTTLFSGGFADNSANNQVAGILTKAGPGTLIFGGNGASLEGGITLNGGTLVFDYSTSNTLIGTQGALTLAGGVLVLNPSTNVPLSQTFPMGTVLSVGHTDIVQAANANPLGSLTFGLNSISRSFGATIDVSTSGAGAVYVNTSAATTNGLLGTGPAFATFGGGSTWATVSSGTITGLMTYGTGAYGNNINTDVVTSPTLPTLTTNSLRFNTGDQTITLSGMMTLQSGGILVTPSATGGTITGGILNATSNGELIVHQYSSGTFTINSSLVSAAGLTKTGPGTLVLCGNNNGLFGPININRGNLTVTTPIAVLNASTINFNDDRPSNIYSGVQQFTADFGNYANGTIYAPIQLSAFGATNPGTYFSTGLSTGATVTLRGAISSAPGLTTSILFTGESGNSSAFDLTSPNTFAGNITLLHGSLGITADANLGNAANTLNLETGDTLNGGLVFLNSGVNVAHPISLSRNTRIISNGTDSNTISGQISGAGSLIKAGTGTLTLTNPNNALAGSASVLVGTLSLGTTGSLGYQTNVSVAAGATFIPSTANTDIPLGTLTLNGGTFRVASGLANSYVNQIIINAAGGTIDFTGAGFATLVILGGGGGVTINGNSTWLSPGNGAQIVSTGTMFEFAAPPIITIAAGVTLTDGMALGGTFSVSGFIISGGGTLFQNSDATNVLDMNAALTVSQSVFRVIDASSNGGVGNLGTGLFTLDGGSLSYGGSTASTAKAIGLTANGGTIAVELAATTLTANGAITGLGGLTKTGPGTLILGSGGNTFTGLTVTAGTVQTANDNTLGFGNSITVAAAGTLLYTGTTTTARTINLNFGTLQVAGGATLTLSGAAVNGGYLAGPGAYAATGGAALTGVTTFSDSSMSVTGPAAFTNYSNGSSLTVAAGLTAPVSFTRFTNEGSGAIVVGAASTVNVSAFQSYGMLTLAPNTTSAPTILTNTGTSPLFFDGGSQTFIGTPATADPTGQNILDYMDLHGNNAIVAGGYFVNNGGVYDTVGAGTGTIIADYGALVKGAGFYQNTVKTINGGKFQTGNSPGSATFGNFVFGPGGVNNYVFAIDDATGTAGPSPGPSGLVSGWGLIKAVQVSLGSATTSGNFIWTATPSNPLTVAIDTLVNPTTVGTDVTGPMANFDPNQSYAWTAARWTGAYSGPTDAATLDADTTFDTSGFVNPIAGTFGWSLDPADQTLSLTYTPSTVPEPGTLALVGVAAVGLASWRRRGRPISRPHPGPA